MLGETRYARSGDVSIAYQVLGDGPFDVVYVPGAISNVELLAQDEMRRPFFEQIASYCRLILFDKRGTGASDRVAGIANLETRMDDVRAVMDAVGSERAAVVGVSEGGAMSILFAATYPERTAALVVYGAMPRYVWAPDFPWGQPLDEFMREAEEWAREWGDYDRVAAFVREGKPDATEEEIRWRVSFQRLSASPGALIALERMNAEIDVRHVLRSIRVPTLVLVRAGDLPLEVPRWMAHQISGARLVELPAGPHFPYLGDSASVLRAIEEFVRGVYDGGGWEAPEPDRVLATILFTDIVGSTAKAVELGDRGWRALVERHHALVRQQLARYRGRELDTAGDGFFASFDGPARGVRCARAISAGVHDLGIDVRAGLHTGECEVIEGKVGGIAVHIGARVAAQAGPGEVLVSSTVRDLVAGSGLEFLERGHAELKGVPGEWRLYAVAAERNEAAVR